jgi:hypothetical protein
MKTHQIKIKFRNKIINNKIQIKIKLKIKKIFQNLKNKLPHDS